MLTDFLLHFFEDRQASADENDVHLPAGELVHVRTPNTSSAAGDN